MGDGGQFQRLKKWATEDGIGIHSHARYACGTDAAPVFSGRVECMLTAETPFIIGGKRDKNTDGSTTVHPYKIRDQLTVPATSIKGMVGSIAEAASGSAMRVMDTSSIISFRKPVSSALSLVGYVFYDDERVLRVNPLFDGNHYSQVNPKTLTPIAGKQLVIRALSPPIPGLVRDVVASKFREIQVHAMPPSLVKPATLSFAPKALSNFEQIADQRTRASLGDACKDAALPYSDPSFKTLAGLITPYHLMTCVMSHPQGQWGRAVGWNKRNGAELPTTLFEQLQLRPQAGDVIYYKANGNTIVEFSYSRVWRGLVSHSDRAATYADFLPDPKLRPFAAHRTTLTFAELLLGFVQDDGKPVTADNPQALAFSGKLRFHDSPLSAENYSHSPAALKLLSSPKPPSPALYFTSKSGAKYIRKSELAHEKHQLRGRKQYLHALGVDTGQVAILQLSGAVATAAAEGTLPWLMSPLAPNTADKHAKQRTHASLISEGATCDFAIDFDNLTLEELQLLAFSLRPAPSFRHKLGMGKGIGLGTVRLDPRSVQLVDRLQRYGADALCAQRHTAKMTHQQLAILASSWRESKTAESAKKALLAIGNPANVKHPVHVPQTKGLSIENETFGWFVDNDCEPVNEPHQTLPDITDVSAELPTLLRYTKRTQR